MNLRTLLGSTAPLCAINREERNLGAILFHLLNVDWPDNLLRFVKLVGYHDVGSLDEAAIYFEYAFLRDIWHASGKLDRTGIDRNHNRVQLNLLRRSALIELLAIERVRAMFPENNHEWRLFNEFFGAQPTSTKYIQSPGRWGLKVLHEKLEPQEFAAACHLKWAFNAKPDLVIHFGQDRAICVELKLESRQSSYPSAQVEKAIFASRGPFGDKLLSQSDLQKHVMKLLGVDAEFVLISPRAKPAKGNLSWTAVFTELVRDRKLPFYMMAAIETVRTTDQKVDHG